MRNKLKDSPFFYTEGYASLKSRIFFAVIGMIIVVLVIFYFLIKVNGVLKNYMAIVFIIFLIFEIINLYNLINGGRIELKNENSLVI